MIEDYRRAIAAAPRAALDEIARATWRAFAAGGLDEAQAQALAELIESRKIAPPEVPKIGTSRRPPRPRSPASVERRRRWVASGWMPPQLAARFTMAEAAALAVVAAEARRGGACMLPLDAIAGRAGVSRSTVRNAIGLARRLGLLTVEERRLTACRSLPNVVRVTSPEWCAWLAMRGPGAPRGEGAKTWAPQSTHIHKGRQAGYKAGLPHIERHGSRGSRR